MAEKNCFQESFKANKTVRISKFWQRVPDCRASLIQSPTAVRAKGRNPHKRTSWKLVGNPGRELVAN